jgi:hypothetical protein
MVGPGRAWAWSFASGFVRPGPKPGPARRMPRYTKDQTPCSTFWCLTKAKYFSVGHDVYVDSGPSVLNSSISRLAGSIFRFSLSDVLIGIARLCIRMCWSEY